MHVYALTLEGIELRQDVLAAQLTPRQRQTYVELAMHQDAKPNQRQLAQLLGCHRNTVSRAMKRLRELGAV